MQNGDSWHSQFFISSREIRIALDSLVNHSSARPELTWLRALILVDQFLADLDLLPIHQSCDFAIYEILTRIITDELAHQRKVPGLLLSTKEFETIQCLIS